MLARARRCLLRRMITLALWLVGCATPKPPVSSALEVLTDDAKIEEQRLDGASLALPYEIKNSGGSAATLDAIVWRLSLEGEAPQQGTEKPARAIGAGAV